MEFDYNFEQGLARIDEIAALLATSDTPLEDAVRLYSEAAELTAHCKALLDNAKLRVEKISVRLEEQGQ